MDSANAETVTCDRLSRRAAWRVTSALRRGPHLAILGLCCGLLTGCQLVPAISSDDRGVEFGKTFYVSGAGPVGNVTGSGSVRDGLRDARYRGAIEIFGWQALLGGTLRDQIDVGRNRREADRLARRIVAYQNRYPRRPVHLIGLSAGTGIITFALEALPPGHRVEHVVFLGSSLYREYDLDTALRKIRGNLWNIYSPKDRVLRYAVPLTGSVDRGVSGTSVAGLVGLAPPAGATDEQVRRHQQVVNNLGWRERWSRYDYDGGHTDSVEQEFIANVVATLLKRPLRDLDVDGEADMHTQHRPRRASGIAPAADVP